jgi:hypothetical protein
VYFLAAKELPEGERRYTKLTVGEKGRAAVRQHGVYAKKTARKATGFVTKFK